MAMQVLEKKNKGVNFSNNQEKWEKIRDLLTSDVSSLGKNKVKSPKAHKEIKVNFKEINCIRFTYSVFTLLIVYIIITAVIHNQIDKKTNLAQEIIDDTKVKTQKVNEYTTLIDARTKNYEAILEQLKEASERAEENYRKTGNASGKTTGTGKVRLRAYLLEKMGVSYGIKRITVLCCKCGCRESESGCADFVYDAATCK